MERQAPIGFKLSLDDDPKFKALRKVKNGKLGQALLRKVGQGMSEEAFEDFKASMGEQAFSKAVAAVKTQDERTNETYLKLFAKYVYLMHLYSGAIKWEKYKCLSRQSPCFRCKSRACGKSAPEVVLELLEREHNQRMKIQKKQPEECCCPHNKE